MTNTTTIQRLTIVLTLKDRPEFTRRWMRYMNDQGCLYRILIADGGADKEIEAELRNPANYPALDYEYIRYPFDKEWTQFYAKKIDVCQKVETEYVLMADNDDFYLLDNVPLLIDFLDKNPDYSGCRGAVAQMFLMSEKGELLNAPFGESYRAVYHECRSIEDEGFIERVERYFNELVQYSHQINWYCVYRRESMVRSVQDVYKYNYSDVVLNEILFLLSLLREGKIKVMEPLYYLRQVGSSQAETGLVAENNVLEWFLINDAFHQFSDFIISEGFVSEEGDRIRILKSFSNYVGMYCSECDKYHKKNMVSAFMQSLRSWLKEKKTLFRFVYAAFLPFSHRIRGTRKMHAVRVPVIEPYVLHRKS